MIASKYLVYRLIFLNMESRFLSLVQNESNRPKMYFSLKLNSRISRPTRRFLTRA